jgi:hypothetical protein
MEIVTKEHLNRKGPGNIGRYLKCDIPIWEEFALGLVTTGGIALNNNFRGMRAMFCHAEDRSLSKVICIVTQNPKEQKIYNLFESGFHSDESRGDIKDLKIEKFDRFDKNVYVIEYKRNN